jgi:hypothetical protein
MHLPRLKSKKTNQGVSMKYGIPIAMILCLSAGLTSCLPQEGYYDEPNISYYQERGVK